MVSGRLVTGASPGVPLGSLSSWASLLEAGRELSRELPSTTGPTCSVNAAALAAAECSRGLAARPCSAALPALWTTQRRELHGACGSCLAVGCPGPSVQASQRQPCRAYTDGAEPLEPDDLSKLAHEWQRLSLTISAKGCTASDGSTVTDATQIAAIAPTSSSATTATPITTNNTFGPATHGADSDLAADTPAAHCSDRIPLHLVETTCTLLDWRHSLYARSPQYDTTSSAGASEPGSAAAVADIISAAASSYSATAGPPPSDLARSLVAAATAVAQVAPWPHAATILDGLVRMGTVGTRYLDWTLARIQQIPPPPKPPPAGRFASGGHGRARDRSWRGDRWGAAGKGPGPAADVWGPAAQPQPQPQPPGFQVDLGPSAEDATRLLTSLSVVHGVQGGAGRNAPLAMLRLMQHLQARLDALPGPAALLPLLHSVTSCGWRHDREPEFLRSVGDYLSAPGPPGPAAAAGTTSTCGAVGRVDDDEEGLVGRARLLALTPAQLVTVLDAYRRAGVHHSGLMERALDAVERCLPAFTPSQAARLAEACARFSHFRPALMRRLAHHMGAHLPAAVAPGDVAAVVTSLARCRVREDRVMAAVAAYAAEHAAAWSAELCAAATAEAGGRGGVRGREACLQTPLPEPAAPRADWGHVEDIGTQGQQADGGGGAAAATGGTPGGAGRAGCHAAGAGVGGCDGLASPSQPDVGMGRQGFEPSALREAAYPGSQRGAPHGQSPRPCAVAQSSPSPQGKGEPGVQAHVPPCGLSGAGTEAGDRSVLDCRSDRAPASSPAPSRSPGEGTSSSDVNSSSGGGAESSGPGQHLLRRAESAPKRPPVPPVATANDISAGIPGRTAATGGEASRASVSSSTTPPMHPPREEASPQQQSRSLAHPSSQPTADTQQHHHQHQRQQPRQLSGSAAYQVSLERIAAGGDGRTGLFVGRLPPSLEPHRLLDELLAVPGAEIDMFYMPYDYAAVGTGSPGRGCAFLSVTSPAAVAAICRRLRSGPVCGMKENASVEYTPAPNTDALLRTLLSLRYPHMAYVVRNSGTRSRPLLLYVSGSLCGQVQPLEPSDVVLHEWPRLAAPPGRQAVPAAAPATVSVATAAAPASGEHGPTAATTEPAALQHWAAVPVQQPGSCSASEWREALDSTPGPGRQDARATDAAAETLPVRQPAPRSPSWLLTPVELALVAHGMASLSYHPSGFLDALAQLMLDLTASVRHDPSLAGGLLPPPPPPPAAAAAAAAASPVEGDLAVASLDPLAPPPLKSLLHALHALTSRPNPDAAACSQLADVCANVMQAWLPPGSAAGSSEPNGVVPAALSSDGGAGTATAATRSPPPPPLTKTVAERFVASLLASGSNPARVASRTAAPTHALPAVPSAASAATHVRHSVIQDVPDSGLGRAPCTRAPLPPPEVLDILVKLLAQALTAAADHGPPLLHPRLAATAAALLRHHLPELRPRAACALLQPLVRANLPYVRQLVRAVAPLLSQQPERLSPPSLVNLAWACARTGYRDNRRLVRALAARTEQLLPQLSTAGAAQLFWALAVLHHDGGTVGAGGASEAGAGPGGGAAGGVYQGLLQLLRERYDLGARDLLLVQEGLDVCRRNGLLTETSSATAFSLSHDGSSSNGSSSGSNTAALMDAFLRELLERAGQSGGGTAVEAAAAPAQAAAASSGDDSGRERVKGPSSDAAPRGGTPGGPGREVGCLPSQQLTGNATGQEGPQAGDVAEPVPDRELEASSLACMAALGGVLGDAAAGHTEAVRAPGAAQADGGQPVTGTGTQADGGQPVTGTGTQADGGQPVTGTGTQADGGQPVTGTGTQADGGQPVTGTGTQVSDAAGVVGFSTFALASLGPGARQSVPVRRCNGPTGVVSSADYAGGCDIAAVGELAVAGEDATALAVRGLLQQIMVARQGLALEETGGLLMQLRVSAAVEAQALAASGVVAARI